jgi:hypothetical protein
LTTVLFFPVPPTFQARSPTLQRLIHAGIPLWMKGHMWQFISNSFAHQITVPKNYYESLVAQQHESWLEIAKFAEGTKRDEVTVRVFLILDFVLCFWNARNFFTKFSLSLSPPLCPSPP